MIYTKTINSKITMNIGNEKWAQILVNSISVDKEVNPDNFQRHIIQENDKIIMYVICSMNDKLCDENIK